MGSFYLLKFMRLLKEKVNRVLRRKISENQYDGFYVTFSVFDMYLNEQYCV